MGQQRTTSSYTRITEESGKSAVKQQNFGNHHWKCTINGEYDSKSTVPSPSTRFISGDQCWNLGNSGPNNSSNKNTQSNFSSRLNQNQHCGVPNRNTNNTGNYGRQNQQGFGTNTQFPNRDYRYEQQQRDAQPQTRFGKSHNQRYSAPAYPPTPSINSSFAGNYAVSRSLIQIAQNQTRSINALLVSQQSQIDAYREMTGSNQMYDDHGLFSSIPVYGGSDSTLFQRWLDEIDQATHLTNKSLRKEFLKKSGGIVWNTLSMLDDWWMNDAIVAKLRQDFSSMSTMNKAWEELKSMVQPPGQPISVYIYKYD